MAVRVCMLARGLPRQGVFALGARSSLGRPSTLHAVALPTAHASRASHVVTGARSVWSRASAHADSATLRTVRLGRIASVAACACAGLAAFAWGSSASAAAAAANARELCELARYNSVRKLEQALRSGADPDARHPCGWAPLHVAAVKGNADAVLALLKAGADPNIADNYDPQAGGDRGRVMQALQSRLEEFDRRIDPRRNFNGFSPLHYAVLVDALSVVQVLLDNGADPLVTDGSGHTASEYAEAGDEGGIAGTPAARIREILTERETQAREAKARAEKEMRRKYPLEQRLKERLVGQVEAIHAIASAIRRKENGWQHDESPLVFLFLGSSGIGKTELAKQLARYVHNDNAKGFIRIDMSEFQSKHEVSKFIGSPPGYVGHEEGGQLTERLRECPNAVVLLDEVEKAHPDVLTVMLQLFDEGRLTDGKGNTISCPDAVFVMTSNLASDEIAGHALALRREARRQEAQHHALSTRPVTEGGVSERFKEEVVRPILKAHFQRDEFLGRINDILYFLPFDDDELKALAAMEMGHWAKKAEERHGIKLTWAPEVVSLLIAGYNVHYGARSIRHEVDRRVINLIALAHERDEIGEGDAVHVVTDGSGHIDIQVTRAEKKSWGDLLRFRK